MKLLKLFSTLLLFIVSNPIISQTPENFYSNLKKTDELKSYDLKNIAKQMAKNFATNRAKDFASEFLHYKSIEHDGKYCEFDGCIGIYQESGFDQSKQEMTAMEDQMGKYYFLLPVSVLRSDPFNIGTEVLSSPLVATHTFTADYEYNPTPIKLLLLKRTIELFSPLNGEFTECFNYSTNGFYINSKGEQLASITFETKKGTFPKETRLYGKGTILYNISTKTPEKIYLENHVDFYTTFYNALSYSGYSVTKHKLEVNYLNIDNVIYPIDLSLSVDWIDPNVPNGKRAYQLINSPRPDPFKHKLKLIERCEFTNPIHLTKEQKSALTGKIANIFHRYYDAPYDSEMWGEISLKGIDYTKLKNDLNRSGRTLEEQANNNALSWYEWYVTTSGFDIMKNAQRIKFSKTYYKNALEVSKIIWK